jgi:phosphoglucosamine mutase
MEISRTYPQAVEEHVERVLQDFGSGMKLKVVVDCGCGAASLVTPYLLRRMGCEVLALNCDPSGHFPRDIEPILENLGTLVQVVKATGADLGIAHDGDGDRMVAIDDAGRMIPGDKLLILFARELGAGQVVATVDASMAVEESGFEVIRTRVGDAFVSDELKLGGDFGGEPSGCWIFPSVSYCPDGIYAAAQIIRIACEKRLTKLVDDLPSYPILRGSVMGEGVIIEKLEQRLMENEPISINTIDGLRLSFDDGWLLIRPSGTEPKIRLTAEARSEARAQSLYDLGIEAIRECTRK